MSSTDNKKSGGRGNRGGGRGRGNRRKRGGGGGDQTVWRALEKPYREWLVKCGIAVNADAFKALSIPDRLSASSAYSEEVRTTKRDELTALLRCTLISQANPYTAIQ
jgi:hypothetical protein